MNTKKIKRLWAEYEKAENLSDDLYRQLEADPENEKIEAAWDEAYNKEFSAFKALEAEIVKITSGMIEPDVARAMITTKREQLKSLIARLV
jgi:hypothetical protein